MNIFRLAAEIFLIYLLYKLIFEFVVPLYQSTKKIRRQFSEMQEKMQQDSHNFTSGRQASGPSPAAKKEGDYIEFEEIK